MSKSDLILSVVMANYNHGHYLEKRIRSLCEEMPPNSELIIVDDASTDNSVSIIQQLAKTDSRIKLFQNLQNQGVVRTSNRGTSLATGQYITMLSADDEILPGFFQKSLELLLKYPEIPLICSDCGQLFEGDQIHTTKLLETDYPYHYFSAKELPKIFRTTNFWIPGHTTLLKRSSVLKHHALLENLGFACDWYLVHAIALTEGALYLPETLSLWRIQNASYSSATHKKRRAIYKELVRTIHSNQQLRPLFRRACLLHFYFKPMLLTLLKSPESWDCLLFIVLKIFIRKFKKIRSFKREEAKIL